MKKIFLLFVAIFFASTSFVSAQQLSDFKIGAVFQKTQSFYWENGLGLEYHSESVLNNHLHLQMTFLTSRLGSAMIYENAVSQDQVNLGADWHFGAQQSLQFFAGVQTGYFKANYELPTFDVLPQASLLMAAHIGFSYDLKPFTVNTKVGYHLINGDGATVPGTLFPVYYQLGVYYHF